jgi:Ankyrin repeats (3 copies)
MAMDTELASRLLAAARAGDAPLIRALVPCCGSPEEDGPPDAPGGITPLMAAAAAGHEGVVEVLLECGADAAKRDTRGRRAAAHARAGGHPCLAKRLDTVVDKDETIW